MTPSIAFFYDVSFLAICLHFIVYIIYGRVRRKPLIGNYRPGEPGYKAFIKIVDNNTYLTFAILGCLLATAALIYDAYRILQQPDYTHSVLISTPVLVVVIFVATSIVVPIVLARKNK